MNVRKFTANTSREALRMLREALGADAVILSNRNVDGKVEILAMEGDVVNAIPPAVSVRSSIAEVPDVPRITPPFRAESKSSSAPAFQAVIEQPRIAPAFASANEMSDMMSEIRSMRTMLESQLAELSWANTQQRQPQKAEVLREMLATGLSASLSRFMVGKMPDNESAQSGIEWIKSILARNLSAIDNESEILEKGGVYALVGPTGVGKTTTTAKLAARCVMRHGPSKLALITTDGYRIGGYEQLRIYGKILGVMVHAVKDESDLRIALSELKNKHTVLIDTVGVSQRDKMVTDQVAMLSGADAEVKRLLCLNATSTGETLSEVVRAYQGTGLAGCILTKLDEAATIGGALDIAIRQKLTLYYVASGQRVPEDLHVANKQHLIDRAFKLKRETAAFRYLDEELPLLMSAAVATSKGQISSASEEVSFG
ncbi:flagellar biosynthesis protein FlhF [Undibacterium jejuense]|uniref:Flagellar biosynthesis protein FlhF n=1 Tax=Undibacterium jejuense TaxID=1344949 RepID=A0A923KMZ7_9BURK|nr:flagellar biosynthesis protein FlhF [Undibacterium jejuense]MBC3860669.1 flagellar biosynthesis protein FlhF [Undibacterium jejuense]